MTASSTPFVLPRADEEKVFDQAIDYVYMPLVPAPQRSPLFRLLAATSRWTLTPGTACQPG